MKRYHKELKAININCFLNKTSSIFLVSLMKKIAMTYNKSNLKGKIRNCNSRILFIFQTQTECLITNAFIVIYNLGGGF